MKHSTTVTAIGVFAIAGLFGLVPRCLGAVANEDLFPFGLEQGDQQLKPILDVSSDIINLEQVRLPFFGYWHSSLWVSSNGGILFSSPENTFETICLPTPNVPRMITPFWSDTDPSLSGAVFYRLSFNESDLNKTRQELSTAFYLNSTNLKWSFIATWVNLTMYGAQSLCSLNNNTWPKNTFQVVVTTDGLKAFALFYYNQLTWTTSVGPGGGGGNCQGLGGIPASAGFHDGYGKSFTLNGSCLPDVIKLVDQSNTNHAGKWAFRIDQPEIQSPLVCGPNGAQLRIVPASVERFGKVPIELIGPCVPSTATVTCSFFDRKFGSYMESDAILYENGNAVQIFCSTPMFHSIGPHDVTLLVQQDEVVNTFAGVLCVTENNNNMGKLDISVTFLNLTYANITLQWAITPFRRAEFTGTVNSVKMIEYDIRRSAWVDAYVFNNTVTGRSTISFTTDTQYIGSLLRDTIGQIVVEFDYNTSGKTGKLSSPLQSRMFSKFESALQFSAQMADSVDDGCRDKNCDDWYNNGDPNDFCNPDECTPTAKGRCPPPCQPTSQRAGEDGNYKFDSCLDEMCLIVCYRSRGGLVCGPDNFCCYNSITGNILNDRPYSGSIRMSSSESCENDQMTNDLLPYYFCCIQQHDDRCSKYGDKRPTDPGKCSPQTPSNGGGDPHFTTFDKLYYTFNPIGEVWLLKNSALMPVAIQARAQQVFGEQVTGFYAFVLKSTSSPAIQMQRNDSTGQMDVYVDGQVLDVSDNVCGDNTYSFDGGYFIVSSDSKKVTVTFSRILTFEVVILYSMWYTATIYDSFKGNYTHGLMGVFDGDPNNDLQSPDGTIIPPTADICRIHFDFGLKWRITKEESLFYYGDKNYSYYDHPEFQPSCDMPDLSKVNQTIKDICGDPPDPSCVFDYLHTGNKDMGKESYNSSQKFNDTSKTLGQKFVFCPPVKTPENGSVSVSNYLINGTATFTCYGSYIVHGDQILYCVQLANGTAVWNATEPTCGPELTTTTTTTTTTTAVTTTSTVAHLTSAGTSAGVIIAIVLGCSAIVVVVMVASAVFFHARFFK